MPRLKRPTPTLDPARIAREALALVDAEGLEALSMRTLARRLRVEAMSLYHHLPSKDALLDAVMELLVEEIEIPAEGPWEERVRTAVRAHRRVALRHPHAYLLLLTRPYRTPRLLAYCERLASTLAALGMDAERTARAFRFIGHFVDGATLYASAGPARATAPPVPPPVPLDPALYPHLTRVGPHLSRVNAEAHFEFGLDLIIAELRRMAGEKRG